MTSKKLDTAPYKGVRDFYPEDMGVQKHLFDTMRSVVEGFGYTEYGASILEPSDLYKAKSGEEIVNEQTYTFIDRGGREVTLRPEMTPTVARMVAARKRDLGFPLRWYSIPNLFRYENPQRGRLREHYQLNVDIFGVTGLSAEVEIISIAHKIMTSYGASDGDFSVLLNSRKLIKALFETLELDESWSQNLSKIMDKKDKLSPEAFAESVKSVLGDRTQDFVMLLSSGEKLMDRVGVNHESVKTLLSLISSLEKLGIKNVIFTPTLMRGFDYYTDIVFEVFDTHKDNRRSLFGGGRYDNLLELFGGESVPAVGFGMGDVTLIDFLATHDLLPLYQAKTEAILTSIGSIDSDEVALLAKKLRDLGLNVAINTIAKKPADAIKNAVKQGVKYMIFVGEDELAKKLCTLKNLSTEETFTLGADEIVKKIHP
jgi:histidyl-tRNA synthetase